MAKLNIENIIVNRENPVVLQFDEVTEIDKNVREFVEYNAKVKNDYYSTDFWTDLPYYFGYVVIKAKKYYKVLQLDISKENNKSINHYCVHAFIDIATGAILKPASFNSPAKGVRGYVTGDYKQAITFDGFIRHFK